MKHERLIEVPGWIRPIGHIGGVTASGWHIFLAGQVGLDEQGHFVSAP
ncbi:enamine deaminase RidA (YjgF/YER057c/UK114 family) [Variovorax boronicumulans]|uniref:Enamine deaminase RidA (YjgF/YER057c/UK114 family) n=1 Tax=Variovorax boronicumulans TaxID=436515 RepID=A0AAW8D2B1_9BURK|nr:enamine deaminase RidA (YjgF/YER057c/UK114 family) [Variovorax boronicumulans]MDP9993962.1 enamine deaminase RidA (YjgF/YER057c/UK114 family) [Variovorax boronicumulans]MDQ0005175.1 enamine deaminase RidA (YjgF/YER057c/UK114 family) [Variovorax boronicumulans]MDQ0044709.1 enamine deaminase RidA (YjgF/YER057c/UK114 family) [Variovorax boronicumulans]MDQ0056802.1 enamine deaminase RidA (YjgF/YER057c/UK114 family) [Variovorax boronicumulans]